VLLSVSLSAIYNIKDILLYCILFVTFYGFCVFLHLLFILTYAPLACRFFHAARLVMLLSGLCM
jgi:hypothetical protein